MFVALNIYIVRVDHKRKPTQDKSAMHFMCWR